MVGTETVKPSADQADVVRPSVDREVDRSSGNRPRRADRRSWRIRDSPTETPVADTFDTFDKDPAYYSSGCTVVVITLDWDQHYHVGYTAVTAVIIIEGSLYGDFLRRLIFSTYLLELSLELSFQIYISALLQLKLFQVIHDIPDISN